MNRIKIHLPDGIGHGYGIEFNYELSDSKNDAKEFITACKTLLDNKYGWFHQSGCDRNYGYQFFEMLNSENEDVLLSEAQKIADYINAEIVL